MDKLTRVLSKRLSNNNESNNNSRSVYNKEIIINENFDKNLNNWKMPVYSTGKYITKVAL